LPRLMSEIVLEAYPDLVFAWHGHSLLVTDRHGMIAAEGIQGLYEHDLRLLSSYRLRIHGRDPRLVALSAVQTHATLAYFVTHPDADSRATFDALGLSE